MIPVMDRWRGLMVIMVWVLLEKFLMDPRLEGVLQGVYTANRQDLRNNA